MRFRCLLEMQKPEKCVSILKKQRSCESTEPSSSITPRACSSAEPPTSCGSALSTSISTSKNTRSVSASKTSTKNTKKISPDKIKPSSSKNKVSPNQKGENPTGVKKKKHVNIQQNPLAKSDLNQQDLAESKKLKSSTTDTLKSSTAPLTSVLSTDETDLTSPSAHSKTPRTTRSVSFESLSSVSLSTENYSTSDELNPFEEPRSKPYYKGITNVINPRICNILSKSTPICSQYIPQEDRYNTVPVQEEFIRPVKRQPYSTHGDFHDPPPSPAPTTSLEHEPRHFHFNSKGDRHELYQRWPTSKRAVEDNVSPGPRIVYITVPDNSGAFYHILQPDQTEEVPYNQYYYESSTSTGRFQTNLDTDSTLYHFSQDESYAERIYKQYQAKGRGSHRPTFGTRDNYIREPSPYVMNAMDDTERKIIIEFCHLLEKSKQLFNVLRELPQYGHKQWSLHFGRTFDIYTRLWKYQQQHRAVLDSKYGMKRWQIGEIASKIGQLYYHFYLRTSEMAYLSEAFSFYYAIRGRCYYTKANKEDKCELMVKKLRYYARFIVVCLLLKKMKLVKELIKELDRQIIEYGNTYDPDDQAEWADVIDEVKAFVHAEPVVAVIHPDNYSVTLSHRLTSLTIPPIERSAQMNLSLQEILIVGSSSQQVKFSELTMDMFRIIQTLEREPMGDLQLKFNDSPRQRFIPMPSIQNQDSESGQKIPNPHKYLLFKPSTSQMLVYLASGCNDLPPNGALLLYVSADGYVPPTPKHSEEAPGYDLGGVITSSRNEIQKDCGKDQKAPASKFKEFQCLYPGDLYPFTRKPFFLIVDSDNSYAFQGIPRHFGQPMVILMSPLELPSSFHDRRQQGGLFTLFLHSPLSAFCFCCDIDNISLVHWDRGQIYIDNFIAEASAVFVRSRTDISYISFMGDEFLRLLLLRFVFCEVVLRLHRGFRARTHLTRCSPPLPDDLFEHPALIHIVMDLANHLQVRSHFHDPTIVPGPPSTKD